METEARLLLITEDPQLRDEVALIAATVGAGLESRGSWHGVEPQRWAVLMCGPDHPPPHQRLARKSLMLTRTAGDPSTEHQLWRTAAEHPGLRPVPLPAGESWLAQHLSEAVLDRSPGRVVAVAGALGGAGASTIAYLLAAELVVRGASAVLVDADPSPGAGIASLVETSSTRTRRNEALAGSERIGWEALGALDGEISAAQLGAALPVTEGIHVVSGNPGAEVRRRMLAPVVHAARRAFDWVILDVSRDYEVCLTVVEHLDHLLLVTSCSASGARAARQVSSCYPELPLALLVNGLSHAGWSPDEVSSAAGVPLAGDVPEQRWMRRESELGSAYELLRSRRGAAYIGTLLESLDSGASGVAGADGVAGTQVLHE